jgi:hypothetical protein
VAREGIAVKTILDWPNVGTFGVAPGMARSFGRLRIEVHNTTEISFFQQKT